MIKLLIADDHAIMRGGVKQVIALAPDIMIEYEAGDGAEVLQQVANGSFDLLLLDMAMPGIGGTDLIGQVKAIRGALPVLVLSLHNEPQVAARAFKAGASGYVTKDSEPEKILEAIRWVAGGHKYIDPSLAEKAALAIAFSDLRQLHASLSKREFEVLLLLAKGISIAEIAERLAISSKAVNMHKMKLMEKMDCSSTAALVRYVAQYKLLG